MGIPNLLNSAVEVNVNFPTYSTPFPLQITKWEKRRRMFTIHICRIIASSMIRVSMKEQRQKFSAMWDSQAQNHTCQHLNMVQLVRWDCLRNAWTERQWEHYCTSAHRQDQPRTSCTWRCLSFVHNHFHILLPVVLFATFLSAPTAKATWWLSATISPVSSSITTSISNRPFLISFVSVLANSHSTPSSGKAFLKSRFRRSVGYHYIH